MTQRSFAFAALALSLVACQASVPQTPSPETPAARLSRVERRANGSKSPGVLGEAAAITYLLAGDAAQANAWADKALGRDAAEPLASFVKAELAREALDEGEVAKRLLAVLKNAPSSPWAELAAGRLSLVVGQSPAVDALIEEALGALDEQSLGLEGRAALRAREALLAVRDGRNEDVSADATRRAIGLPGAWTVVGPLGAFAIADIEAQSPFDDPTHVLAESYPSPSGAVRPRVLETPNGMLSVEQEPRRGDVFEALVDVDVQRGGRHLVSLSGATMATVWVDGVRVLERRGWPDVAPSRSWAGVDMPVGKHRVRVRFTRSEASWLSLALAREDGIPAALVMTAPTPGKEFVPAAEVKRVPPPGGALAWAEARLERDPQAPLVHWARVLAMQPDDPERAQDALEGLVGAVGGETVPLRSLRIDLIARDVDLPRATAKSLIQRDVDAMLKEAPGHLRAMLLRYEHARLDRQWDEAERILADAFAASGTDSPVLLLRRAQLALARGNRTSAKLAADAALAEDPARCDALSMRSDLARADKELAVAERLMPELAKCPGGLGANAAWLQSRSRPFEAVSIFERLVDRHPTSMEARRRLADALLSVGEHERALGVLEPALAQWPRRNDTLVRMASIADLAGQSGKARELRRRALGVDASELSLARAVAFDAGAEVMPWAARDGIGIIDAYKALERPTSAGALQVLDHGALEVQPDGSALERIHSIVKVVDKRGIDTWGEVRLPPDAQVLTLRTVKPDGRVLEAEIIAGKDSISMPNLEPGDFVEVEWLRTHGARPASLPGWQGGIFFFRAANMPFHESTYEVRAPETAGLEVQARNLEVKPPEHLDGGWLRFRHEARDVDAFIAEPMSVGETELLPWVETGAGAGELDVVRQFAEWVMLSTRPTGEVRGLVRGVAAKPVEERIALVAERVRQKVRGRASSMSFAQGAGTIVSGEEGNRLVALKAALAAVGVSSRVVLVRGFTSDPEGYRFPRGDVFSRAVLRVEPEGAPSPVWIDLSNRFAPVGVLPAELGGLEGVVVPEPGEEPERVTLPNAPDDQDRVVVTFDLAFEPDGMLAGTMTQTASGFEAASLRQALEQTNKSDLTRHQEGSLSATFPRVAVESLEVKDSGAPTDAVHIVTRFRAPHYGLRADGVVALPANFGLAQLGRRFLARGTRTTPMLIGREAKSEVRARLTLPEGATVRLPEPVQVESESGRYAASFALDGRVLSFAESLVLERRRVPAARYRDFALFALAVDAAQSRQLPLESSP